MGKKKKKTCTHDSVASPDFASLVTMGFRSVPFLLFLPPLPLAADAATLAICFPLFNTALVRSMPSMCGVEGVVVEGTTAESDSEAGHRDARWLVAGRKKRAVRGETTRREATTMGGE